MRYFIVAWKEVTVFTELSFIIFLVQNIPGGGKQYRKLASNAINRLWEV
jgi:hypothetical protein